MNAPTSSGENERTTLPNSPYIVSHRCHQHISSGDQQHRFSNELSGEKEDHKKETQSTPRASDWSEFSINATLVGALCWADPFAADVDDVEDVDVVVVDDVVDVVALSDKAQMRVLVDGSTRSRVAACADNAAERACLKADVLEQRKKLPQSDRVVRVRDRNDSIWCRM